MEKTNITFRHICQEDTYMFNYTQLPDELFTVELFKDLSLHAKVLYSFMLRRVSISKENSWIDDVGDVYIYYRTDEIMEKFNCSNKTASKIMSELEEIGLIEKIRQGQGKPDIIYVNKFSAVMEQPEETDVGEEPELPIENLEHLYTEKEVFEEGKNDLNTEVKKLHFKKCKNYTSKNVKSTSLEVKKLHSNYKENNYKDLVTSSSPSPPSGSKRREHEECVRLLEEEKEDIKQKIRYQKAEQMYSAQIAKAVLAELIKRDKEYLDKFTSEMFLKTCKSVSASREPIVNLPGFINWCLDRICVLTVAWIASGTMVSGGGGKQISNQQYYHPYNQFNQFMHQDYNFEELEKRFVSNLTDAERNT